MITPSTRYINDMIVRYYHLIKTVRELADDCENFHSDSKQLALDHLASERDRIKNLLDQELAEEVRTRQTSSG